MTRAVTVSRILGESFDFETGAALPKALVLTNGLDEVSVYVEDDTALAVIALGQGPKVPESPEQPQPKKRSKKKPKKEQQGLTVVDELEDYRDSSTGAPSL